MILLRKFNNESFYLNCNLIERIESNPDTVITLVDGKTLRVIESEEDVVERIIAYQKEIRISKFRR